MSDHIHLLVNISTSLSMAQVIQYLKGRSSKKLQEEFPKLRQQFCGQHMWATDYFCRSVGTVTNEIIKEYIENQEDSLEDVFKQENMF